MDFCILGPLEVHAGDDQVPVTGAKARGLLAILLLHANEVVSSDRLIYALWGEQPPETASKTLQVHISRLRKAIGASAIQTRSPGYVLEVGAGELDLHRFQDLHGEARNLLASDPARARDLLGKAFGLWRGPPLADFAYDQFAQREIVRVEELRISATEDRLEADLALGRHQEVIGELESLIDEYPLRERLRAQLLLALYRSGRQAEALEAYQDARRALTEGLGIEPGRDLRALQQAILNQDSELDQRPAAVPSAETTRGVFVGRGRELGELLGALEDALAGRGRVTLLAGEPGIGKSRLAEELMGEARAHGARVLVGRCWEAGGAPAYWPWVQSLRAYARDANPEVLRAQLGPGAAVLAHLLPEIRENFPQLPEPPALDSEGARFRLFEAVSALLRRAAEDRPLVLMLDDLHAADEPSLLLLRFVAREMAGSRLLVVCAFRDVDPTLREPLTSALAELARESHSAQIELEGLGEADVTEYVELSTGIGPEAALVQAICAETEGNPLFVVEVVRLLETEGRIGETNAHLRIPPGVRVVIGQRVGRLSEPCRSLLVQASVMGREFRLDALAQLSERPRDELLEALDEAVAERVVTDVPATTGRLRFGHALIRDTLYDELPSARRLKLHLQVAEALEEVYAVDLEPHLAELAHHFFAAAPAGVTDRAIYYGRRAGDRAVTQLAYEEAVRLYEMALTVVGAEAARCELLLALGDAQARAGAAPQSRQSFSEAARLADALGLDEPLAQAALGYAGRLIWEFPKGDPKYVPLLERALAALGEEDNPLRVRLLARLASGPLREIGSPPEKKHALSEQALAIARRIDDAGTLAYALAAYNAAHHSPAFTGRQVALATELIQIAMEAGDLERAAEGHEQRAAALIELGELGKARADVAALSELAHELRQPSQEAFAAAYRALLALLEGNFAEAEAPIADLSRIAERTQYWGTRGAYDLHVYALGRHKGGPEEIEAFVRGSGDPTYPIWRCVRALTAAELGRVAEAHQGLEALAADGFAALPFGEYWLAGMALLAETAAVLEDASQASVLYPLLLPYADRVAISYADIITGSVSRNLALLALVMERWDDAERHFEDALETNERIGARPWLAHTQRDHAQMLLARSRPGDGEKASQLLAQAVATYGALGMNTYAAAAQALDRTVQR